LRIPDSILYKIFQHTDVQNLLDRLLIGEMFEGRVISVDGNFLIMQLLDGSRITAQVESGTNYNPGDIVRLKIDDRQQGKVIATEIEHYPVQESESSGRDTGQFTVRVSITGTKETERSQIQGKVNVKEDGHIPSSANSLNEKADNPAELLKALKIPVNRQSMEIVRETVRMGSEPKAEIIEKALKLLENEQVDSPRQAVFLVLNKMEDMEQFYRIVSELDNGRFHFNDELNDLVGLLEEAAAETGDENLSGITERIRAALDESIIKTPVVREKPLQPDKTVSDSKFEKETEAALPKADKWLNELKKEFSLLGKLLANSNVSRREEILSAVNRLETAIQFFNELNGIELFVQVPFIVRDNRVNGELYIMKRAGRKGKINSRDFTLFLSLTTDNIGHLDIFVHVKNRNVMVRIFTENEKFNQLFTDEYRTLYDALKEKGYTLFDMGFQVKNEEISIFNAEEIVSEFLDMLTTRIDIKV